MASFDQHLPKLRNGVHVRRESWGASDPRWINVPATGDRHICDDEGVMYVLTEADILATDWSVAP